MAKTEGYENALTKTVKTLRKLNEEMSKELGEDDKICLFVNPDDSGEVVVYPRWVVLFNFANLQELTEFLDASPLKRMTMSRSSKKVA